MEAMAANQIQFSFSRPGNCTLQPDDFFDEIAIIFCELISRQNGITFETDGFGFITDKRGSKFWESRLPLNAVQFVDGVQTPIYSEEARKLPDWSLYKHVLAGRVAKLKAQMV